MNNIEIIGKIKSQFQQLNDGWVFLYAKCNRLNTKVPVWIARLIAELNRKEIADTSKHLMLPTYDGSMQVVHPDVIYWKDEYWLTCTPYPYGVDTYENPCIYRSKNVSQWQVPEGRVNPLAYPVIKKKGYHLSDPCLVVFKDKLHLYYRETHKEYGRNQSQIKMLSTTDGVNWGHPITVVKTDNDTLISPAILTCSEHFFMFHVRLDDPFGGTIIYSQSDDGIHWRNGEEVQVENIPEGMKIWHISIMTEDGSGKSISDNHDTLKSLKGLFVLRGLNSTNLYQLYWASAQGNVLHWRIGEKLSLPEELQKQTQFFYKSTVIPEVGDLLISAKDHKHRWYLYTTPRKEGL